MCFRNGFLLLFVVAVTSACQLRSPEKRSANCVLPPYPNYGTYQVAGDPKAKPGDELEYVYLNVTCYYGNGVIGTNVAICIQGEWSRQMPECVPVCYLQEHKSVKYTCRRPGTETYGPCHEYEPLETFVKPECQPGYYSPGNMPQMRCVGGTWTYVAQCTRECGRVVSEDFLPWAVFIYEKRSDGTFFSICGGTIISSNIILTAAHCFWNLTTDEMKKMEYVVVPQSSVITQTSFKDFAPIKEINIAERFRGQLTNFEDDLAVVTLTEALGFSSSIQPVCLDFDYSFQRRQLKEGTFGAVAVLLDLSTPNGLLQMILVHKIPYIPIEKCIRRAPPSYVEFITGDKFCAGREKSTLIPKGNSGAGLSFPDEQRGITRYYLRGLVSTAPHLEDRVSVNFVAFTGISSLEYFIKGYLAMALPYNVDIPL